MAIRELLVSIGFDVDGSPMDNLNNQIDDFANNVTKSTGFGQDMLNKFTSVGDSMQKIGKKMTTHITTPVMGAVTAVGGLTTALGFKRLVGMDNAQAKLKGLGYEGQAVEKIMQDVNKSVTGTTHTMAEGVDVAAGALAAGVKQGAELERYVTLVGDAATGANRPMDEMAQIFNRIQGSGKLMTNELNQIEHGMPGFSMALAEHLGVAPEKMREMVTAGKVSSSEFLDVMEDFAGGMSDAFAGTWQGMAKNVMANIGILGERMLSGLFQDSKKAMADFLEVLRSEDLRDWAEQTGVSIREFVLSMINGLKQAKAWWDSLSPSIQNIITKVALFGTIALTVAGPILLVFGKILSSIEPVVGFFTKMIGIVQNLGGVFAMLTNPIGLVIAGIILISTAFVLAYQNVEWFRDMVHGVWNWLVKATSEVFNFILEIITIVFSFITEIAMQFWNHLLELWNTHGEFILEVTTGIFDFLVGIVEFGMSFIQGIFQAVWPIISGIVEVAWGLIQTVIRSGIDIVMGLIDAGMSLLQGDWEGAWNAIKGIAENIWHNIESFFLNIDLFQIGRDIIQGLIDGLGSMLNAAKNKALEIATSVKDAITNFFSIASPSRLMRDIFEDVGAGAVWGLDNSITHIVDTAEDFAEKGNPGAYVSDKPSRTSASNTTENYYEFHITVEGGNNDRETAKRIREEIEAFLKEKEVRTV